MWKVGGSEGLLLGTNAGVPVVYGLCEKVFWTGLVKCIVSCTLPVWRKYQSVLAVNFSP